MVNFEKNFKKRPNDIKQKNDNNNMEKLSNLIIYKKMSSNSNMENQNIDYSKLSKEDLIKLLQKKEK